MSTFTVTQEITTSSRTNLGLQISNKSPKRCVYVREQIYLFLRTSCILDVQNFLFYF